MHSGGLFVFLACYNLMSPRSLLPSYGLPSHSVPFQVCTGPKIKYVSVSRTSTTGLKIHPGHNSSLACLYHMHFEQRLTAFSCPNMPLLSFGLWSFPRRYKLSNSVSLFQAPRVLHSCSQLAVAAAGTAGLQQSASPRLNPCWMYHSLSPAILQKERKTGVSRSRVGMCSKRLDLVFSFLDSPISLPDFVLYSQSLYKNSLYSAGSWEKDRDRDL